MIYKKLRLSALAILALSICASGQQKEIWPLPQERHEVEVRLILVDVIATKDGEFFPGLKKDDFELYEDGEIVPINSCDLISLGKSDIQLPAGKKAAVPVIAQKKRLAVLFDGINAWDREFKKAAGEIADELVSLAKSGVEVMILHLDSRKGLKIVQPFTDQEALIRAASAGTPGEKFSPFLEFQDYDDILYAIREAGADLGSGVSAGPVFEIRALEHVNRAADKLRRTIGGLLASFYMLEILPGRKNLLFVSSGFPDLDTFKTSNQFPLLGRLSIFDPFGILGQKIYKTGDEIVREIIRVANDRNISVYSFDPGVFSRNVFAGASAQHFDREGADSQKALLTEKYRQLQNLRMVSEKTGAALLRGADKIESFREIVKNDLSNYYQLSYYPPKKGGQAYHRIEVRVKGREGVRIRFREGYSDSPVDGSKRLALARAFYNPELFFDKLPFRAEFIPLALDSGKSQPWMNIALPGQEFFEERSAGHGKRTYEFHFWIKGEKDSDRILMGNVAMPLDIDSIKDRLSSLDFLRLHFSGPAIELPESEYRVIFALFDPESGEIGTWCSSFPPPLPKGRREAFFLNCTLGNAFPSDQSKEDGSFSLNSKDGSLECGRMRFFPKISGRFSRAENVQIFFQIYFPQGCPYIAKFTMTDKNGTSQPFGEEKVAEFYNERSKIWSAAFRLSLQNATAGDYILKIEVPVPGGLPNLAKEKKIILF